ncbi:hypothetical protein QAD02_006650 [Eretmocerus hayati]|uniref:Uncharacterized protein n=1 Tax=Eretmocerus hayati TaxID=131215 RepID=A0ACC2N1I9_9HYME|nr:hypothetical protein QAD02_006650 [Eretmocerus hayati]
MGSPKCWAASLITIIVVGGGIAGILFWLGPWEKDIQPVRPTSDLLIKTSDGAIKLVISSNSDYDQGTVLVEEYTKGILGFDHYKNKIYYGTTIANDPVFSSAKEELHWTRSWTKTALAVDFITEKVYVLDRMTRKLHVADMQNQYQAVILTDLDDPRDIVLDPEMGLMFILQKSSILQSNLDGTNAVIIRDSDMAAIAIDRDSKIIYFATSKGLESYDYRKREFNVIRGVQSKIISLSVTKNDIFFVTLSEKDSTMRDLNYCLRTQDGSCIDAQTRILASSTKVQEIKSYEKYKDYSSLNPCRQNNCPNLCLINNSKTSSSLSHTCACATGMVPMNSGTACRPATSHLLYVQDQDIRVKVPTNGDSRFDQADESNFQFDTSLLSEKDRVDFDYHYRFNLIIFTSGSTIHYTNLTDESHWTIEGTSGCDYANPVIDWVSNLVYFTKHCKLLKTYSIVRRSIETIGSNAGESTVKKFESGIESLAFHPGFGWIFYLQENGGVRECFVMPVDGMKTNNLFEYPMMALSIDVKSERLLGIYPGLSGVAEISMKNWTFSLLSEFSNTENADILTATGNSIYISNSSNIWTADGSIFPSYASENIGRIRAAKLIGADVQYVDERWNHPCIFNNGGCSRYCLATRQKVSATLMRQCACNDGEKLLLDGVTCSKPKGLRTDLLMKTTDGTVKLTTLTDGDYGEGRKLVVEPVAGIMGYDYYNSKIYYGTSTPNDPIYSSSNEHLNLTKSWTKTALAVDFITEKIYVLDRISRNVYVVDMLDHYRATVLTDLDDPRDIVVDPEMGLMFILQSSSILQCDMDGSGAEIIMKNINPTAIALDRHNKILYFATSKSVESYDYRKKDTKTVMKTSSKIISLSVTEYEVFFVTTRTTNTLIKDLNYCLLANDGTCNEKQSWILASSTNLQGIKVYISQNASATYNPCDWGTCPNLCLLKNSKTSSLLGHTCACTTGMVPMNSGTACRPATVHLLYIQDENIRVKIPTGEGAQFDQADESNFQFDISQLSEKNGIHFDYHYRFNLIIFTSGSTIHYTNLTDESHWTIEGTSGCDYVNPVIDWVSNFVYYIKNCESSKEFSIVRRAFETRNDNGGENTVIKYITRIGSLALHPGHGLLFYTLYNTHKNAKLYSLSVNGMDPQILAKDKSFIETGLSVDVRLDRLYGLVDTRDKILEISLETCQETSHTGFPSLGDLKYVSASRGSIVASNSIGIWAASGSIFPNYASGKIGTIRAAKFVGPDVQYVDERWNHPCISDNGGCSRYCLATKKPTGGKLVRKCACNDDERLQNDGKTCSK